MSIYICVCLSVSVCVYVYVDTTALKSPEEHCSTLRVDICGVDIYRIYRNLDPFVFDF